MGIIVYPEPIGGLSFSDTGNPAVVCLLCMLSLSSRGKHPVFFA